MQVVSIATIAPVVTWQPSCLVSQLSVLFLRLTKSDAKYVGWRFSILSLSRQSFASGHS